MKGFVPDTVQPAGLSAETPDSDVPTGFEPDVEQTPDLQEPMFEEGSLGDRISTKVRARLDNAQDSTRMMMEDEQTFLEAAAQEWGQVLMAGNDTVSETILSALSGMTPDGAEEWLKEQIDTGAEALMSTDTAKDLYQMYRSLEPRTRKNLEAAGNIGLSFLPMKSRVGTKLTEMGAKGEKASLGRYLLGQGTSARKARIAEEGMDPSRQTIRNRESSILNTALTIKGVTASTPRPKMMAALNTEVARLGTDIKKALSQVPTKIPKGTVTLTVNRALSEFKKANPEFASKDLKHIVEKVSRAYLSANKTYNGRPEDLLRVRREFDEIAKKVFKDDILAGNDVASEVLYVVRNTMNQMMQNVAPDAKIRAAMQRQHHALIAKDNLSLNMAMEKNLGDKLISKMEHHPFFVGGVLSGTGVGGQLMGSEATGVAAGLLGAGYVATRPSVQKAAGATLSTVKPTKSLLVDMLNQQGQNFTEQEQ